MSSVWILRSCWLSSSSWPLGLFHYLISIITRYFSLSPGRWIRLQHFIFKLQPGTQNGLISYHSYAGIRIDYRQCKMQDILIISKWKLKFLNFKKLFAVCLNLFRIFRWYWLLEWMTQWWELNVRNTFASFVSKTFSWKCKNAVYRSEHDRYFGASSKRAAIINCASQSHFNGALNVQFVICLEPQAFQLQWKRCTNSMQCAKRNATNTNHCKNFQFLFSQMFCVHHRMFGFRFFRIRVLGWPHFMLVARSSFSTVIAIRLFLIVSKRLSYCRFQIVMLGDPSCLYLHRGINQYGVFAVLFIRHIRWICIGSCFDVKVRNNAVEIHSMGKVKVIFLNQILLEVDFLWNDNYQLVQRCLGERWQDL